MIFKGMSKIADSKFLVVLDLNGTLLARLGPTEESLYKKHPIFNSTSTESINIPITKRPSPQSYIAFNNSWRPVVLRPHTVDFLRWLHQQDFALAFWTSCEAHNAKDLISRLLEHVNSSDKNIHGKDYEYKVSKDGDEIKPLFIWSRDKCQLINPETFYSQRKRELLASSKQETECKKTSSDSTDDSSSADSTIVPSTPSSCDTISDELESLMAKMNIASEKRQAGKYVKPIARKDMSLVWETTFTTSSGQRIQFSSENSVLLDDSMEKAVHPEQAIILREFDPTDHAVDWTEDDELKAVMMKLKERQQQWLQQLDNSKESSN